MKLLTLFVCMLSTANSLVMPNIKPLTTTFDFVGDTEPLVF